MNGKYFTGVVPNNHLANLYFISEVEKAIKNCYGPKSGFSFLTEEDVTADGGYSSKDGVTIIKNLKSPWFPIQMWISQFRNMGMRNDTISGDGTTTTALLAIELYRTAVKAGLKKIDRKLVDLIANNINKLIVTEENAVEVLLTAATISLNNEKELAEALRPTLEKVKSFDAGLNFVAMQSKKVARTGVHSYLVAGVQTVGHMLRTAAEEYEAKTFRLICLPHTLETANDVSNLLKVLAAAKGLTNDPLLIASPSINTFVKEELNKALKSLHAQSGVTFDFDLIELIHPMDDDNIKASEEIALALGCQRIPIAPICIFDPKANNGTGEFRPANGQPEVIEAVKNMVNGASLVKVSKEEILTNITVVTPGDKDVVNARSLRIEELRKKIADERNIQFREINATRLAILESSSVIIEVGGGSNEEAKKLTDMYRDAANHMNAVLKSGVTAGANIGMIRAAGATMVTNPEYTEECIAINNSYVELFDVLSNGALPGADLFLGNVNSGVYNEATYGYNAITGKRDNSVISAVSMEIRMLLTAVEFTNMWLATNQIVFPDLMNAQMYRNVIDEIEAGTISVDNILQDYKKAE